MFLWFFIYKISRFQKLYFCKHSRHSIYSHFLFDFASYIVICALLLHFHCKRATKKPSVSLWIKKETISKRSNNIRLNLGDSDGIKPHTWLKWLIKNAKKIRIAPSLIYMEALGCILERIMCTILVSQMVVQIRIRLQSPRVLSKCK